MSEVTYRTAREDDFPVLGKMFSLLNQYFYRIGYRLPNPENVEELWLDSFRRTLGRFSQIFIAELEDGKIAGFMLCRLKRVPNYMGGMVVGELSDMWIIPEARRLGLGEELSKLALDWLREQNVHSVEVQILRDNEASWKLYEKMGFQREYHLYRLLWDEYIDSGDENPKQ